MAHFAGSQVSPAASFTFKAGLGCFIASWFLPVVHRGTSGVDAFLESYRSSGEAAPGVAAPLVTPLGEVDVNALALGWFEHAWLANVVVLAVLLHVLLSRQAAIGRVLFPVAALGAMWGAGGYAIWQIVGRPIELTPSTGAYLWAGSLVLLALSGGVSASRRQSLSTTTSSARTRRDTWGPSSAFVR